MTWMNGRELERVFRPGLARKGYSLIELLVVIGIITLLVGIGVPSLMKASAQARTVKCMANTSSLAKALEAFRVDHRGRAQLIAQGLEAEWLRADPSQQIFAYEQQADAHGKRQGLPWPVAYGPYVGQPDLRTASDMFERMNIGRDPEEQRRLRPYFERTYRPRSVFLCPADEIGLNTLWSPSSMTGLLSYGMNEDICGVSQPGESAVCWAYGQSSTAQGPRPPAKRLEGRLENVFQPSEVMLFGDIGGADRSRPALYNTDGAYGPYLEHAQRRLGRLPTDRHGANGKIVITFVDGHTAAVVQHADPGTTEAATAAVGYRYTPRVRISPYRPFPRR